MRSERTKRRAERDGLSGPLAFAALEEFYLAEPFFGFGEGFVGAAEILALGREDFVAGFGFADHNGSLLEEEKPEKRMRLGAEAVHTSKTLGAEVDAETFFSLRLIPGLAN